MISLVVIPDEPVKGIIIVFSLFNHPEQKSSDRIVAHDRVKQEFNLLIIPHELFV